MTRRLPLALACLCALVAACATAPKRSAPPEVAALACPALASVTAEQRALLDDDSRALLAFREARCALDAGDTELALARAARLRGPRGEAQRAFIELVVAADRGQDVEVRASRWVSTGHADARAQSQRPWFIPLALVAWERDRAASRAAPLAGFLRELAGVAGRAFVAVDALHRAAPGSLAIAQGEIFESQVVGELARVRVAAIDARWSIHERERSGEGRRTEQRGNLSVTAPDQIVTRSESVETFSTHGHTFVADVPAHALKWRRVVVVGEVAGAQGSGHIKSLLVLPRRAGYDVDREHELNDLSPF